MLALLHLADVGKPLYFPPSPLGLGSSVMLGKPSASLALSGRPFLRAFLMVSCTRHSRHSPSKCLVSVLWRGQKRYSLLTLHLPWQTLAETANGYPNLLTPPHNLRCVLAKNAHTSVGIDVQ